MIMTLQKGSNFAFYETIIEERLIDYNDASNFWSLDKKPSEGGFSVFDQDDQGKVKKMDHPKTIKKGKDPKVVDEDEDCCLVNVEALKSIYLLKKSLISKVDFSILNQLKTMDSLEKTLMQELKSMVPLYLLVKEDYGEIVNMKTIQNSKHPELFRILENYNLWEKRYIHPQVTSK